MKKSRYLELQRSCIMVSPFIETFTKFTLIRDPIIYDEILDIPYFQNCLATFTIRQLSAKYTYIRKYEIYDIYDICQHHSMTHS